MNFFTQAKNAEKAMLFRHQNEMALARKYGAKFKNFTPDSCDFIFPNKEAMQAYTRERDRIAITRKAVQKTINHWKEVKGDKYLCFEST